MHLRRIGLSAAAVAAGLPTLLAGMVVAPAPRLLVGPDDSTVRTQLVADPPPQPSDPSLGLTGAHPPTDPVGMGGQGAGGALDPAQDDNRGVPVRVSGTALPARVLLAYRDAAAALHLSDPACNLSWTLIAGIGKVESGHASGGAVDKAGHTLRPILGPELNGVGPVAAIADSDGGRWDGDTTWDRAVGPMQFIPTSWAVWGQDADADGTADPSDVDDAALATASYLCAGDRDLSQDKDRRSAVFSYNHSWDYVDLVLAWADAYATGTPVQTASLTGGAGGAGSGTGTSGGGTGATAPPGTAVALPPAGPITSPATGGTAGAPAPASPAPGGSTVAPTAAPASAAPPDTAGSTSAPPSTAATPSPTPATAGCTPTSPTRASSRGAGSRRSPWPAAPRPRTSSTSPASTSRPRCTRSRRTRPTTPRCRRSSRHRASCSA